MTKALAGKVALITGGSRGLGAAIAEALAEKGADVAFSYLSSPAKAAVVVEKLEAKGVRALAIQSDQADLTAATPLVEHVIAHFGKLDILVNNAAIGVQGQLIDDPELNTAALDRMWHINVLGTVAVTRAAAQRLTDGGRIIFIGSMGATRVPYPGYTDYSGTKAALLGYSKGVGRDLGHRNITSNVVQPGMMLTDMMAGIVNLPDSVLDLHAIRRAATVEEVAATVTFLAGPDGSYITGAVIDVSGGFQI
ncbi:SDR family oxidoreductase [Novosphingobium sp. PASSN1]|uniref:SDR family NAD(P)-dependent oxidoreductase n=1 Tax=Novosphingobium sp. PASSN1 TaxID=2015561 RepID=UPI000BD7E7B9|nr:SDR family oxidoreductase [Novosphingobium sp. PASSN1]OYU34329.1 MAG: oxidoreductase [Novosphingobium sp. PASSN1]